MSETTKNITADSEWLLNESISIYLRQGWIAKGKPESFWSEDYKRMYWRQKLVKVSA